MDRSLDEILAERRANDPPRRRRGRGSKTRRDRTDDYPRDGIKKSYRDDRNLDRDWVHDKFDDNGSRGSNNRRRRDSPETSNESQGVKLRVDNVHYDLTESDLDELFNRIGRVLKLELRYDRAGRSEGTAFVVYESRADAQEAIKQFDGANANGQKISLTMMPSGPTPRRNPFDSIQPAPRPLAERITMPSDRNISPDRDVDEAARKGIDRYVPGSSTRRSHSPVRRSRGRGDGRRPGTRRDGGGDRNGGRGKSSGGARNVRPKKTQEELDAEMEDYFGGSGNKAEEAGDGNGGDAVPVPAADQDDIDMIE